MIEKFRMHSPERTAMAEGNSFYVCFRKGELL